MVVGLEYCGESVWFGQYRVGLEACLSCNSLYSHTNTHTYRSQRTIKDDGWHKPVLCNWWSDYFQEKSSLGLEKSVIMVPTSCIWLVVSWESYNPREAWTWTCLLLLQCSRHCAVFILQSISDHFHSFGPSATLLKTNSPHISLPLL